jgi:hypothetical protein
MAFFVLFKGGVPIRVFRGVKKGLKVVMLEEYLAVGLVHVAPSVFACKALPVYIDVPLPSKRPYDGLTSGKEKLVPLAMGLAASNPHLLLVRLY